MSRNDGSIIIVVDINDKDYYKKISSMEGKTKSFGAQVKSLLTAVGITKAVSKGFNTLKDSVSSAMNRIDVMNQFTRVMTVMTGSTDKANAALNTLKSITKGTAYGLDVAAASTQKLVTSGMEVNKATKQIKTWGDAVAFYGNGSNASFQNVADAIAKMTSKGKVEMDQLNRLFDAGIPAVEIYASATGKSAAEVQEALSAGEISAQEFTDGLTAAMANGTDKFKSIDGAAKQAGASWSASFDNMKAAVTRGMVNIIESIDKVLKDNGLPTMREMISSIGKTAEKVLGTVAKHLPDIISLVKKLAPVIIAVGTAFATWKVTNTISKATSKILELKNSAQFLGGGLNGLIASFATGSGKIGQFALAFDKAGGGIKGFGKAISVVSGGPITLIIAAIAALVAGFIYLWNTSEEFRDFWIGLWGSIKEFFTSVANNMVKFFTVTIPKAWNSFIKGLQEICANIVKFFQDAWDAVILFFTETIPAWIQSVIDWFNKLPYSMGLIVGRIAAWFVQLGINFVNFLTNDVPNFFNGIIKWFADLPGKTWKWLCEVVSNIAKWGSNMWDTAVSWTSKMIKSVIDFFVSLPGKIWTWLCDTVSKVISWGGNLFNAGKEAAGKLFNIVVDVVKGLPGRMVSIGSDLVKGLWNGIKDVGGWIKDKIGEFCGGIVDGFKGFFGIKSPSRLMRDAIGKFLPPGIAIGFELAMPDASKKMLGETDSMMNDLQKQINLSTGDLSAGITLEKSAKVSQQTSIINQFPKSFTLSGNALQPVYLVTEDGTELAHAIIEPLNRELGLV